MEFPAEDIQPFGSSGLEINDFKINTDNTIFKFLSSSLYSNKIRAIIRELSCNAYDAHIEAGKPNERFLVKLPTLIDPVFKIRDYGTGLSHEDIQNVYTTYLSSTKRNNNDLVGCYGLGSKSPFSYTSMFTVRSYYCGRVSTYQFFAKQGEGVKWTLVSSVSCDEPAGLEVEIEVNKQDISEWVYEAQHVFRPFEIKPEVTGNRGYVDDPYGIRYEGSGWMIVDEIRRHDRGPIALMGNIEYPLQDQHSWSYLVNNLLSNKNLVVRFPLGSFTMNPGRELIEWTPTAIRSIGEFLENVVEDINKQLNSRVLVAKTLFEARKLYLEYVDEFGEDVIQPAFWNGVALTRSSSIPRTCQISPY